MTHLNLNRWSRPPGSPRQSRESGFQCPACGEMGCGVVDSRPPKEGSAGWRRRRQCVNSKCGHRFTTYEYSDDVTIGRKDLVKAIAVQLIAMVREFNKVLDRLAKELE